MEQDRVNKMTEYIKELFRVYLKVTSPPEEELKEYMNSLLNGERTLQDVEGKVQNIFACL